MNIHLRPVDTSNERYIVKLAVAPCQSRFVFTNAQIMAEVKNGSGMCALAVYNNDEPIGLMAYAVERNSIGLWRFMIDSKHQNCGYGTEALKLFTHEMNDKYPQYTIFTTVSTQNSQAYGMYQKAGYKSSGKYAGEEEVLEYQPPKL